LLLDVRNGKVVYIRCKYIQAHGESEHLVPSLFE
jgi:hypothetical protein